MSKDMVSNTFKVIEMMEEMRDILRRTAPAHNLTSSEREEALRIVAKAKEYLGKFVLDSDRGLEERL